MTKIRFFCVPLDSEAHEVEWLRHSHTHVSEFCRPALKLSWLSKEARLPARAFFPTTQAGDGGHAERTHQKKRKERVIRKGKWDRLRATGEGYL